MPSTMDMILTEMLKMWKVTDWHTEDRPWSIDHSISWPGAFAPGELTTEDLQDGCCGGHCGYHNKMVLAVLNLHITPMPSTKPTYYSGADEVWRFSRWPPWGPLRYRNRTIFAILNLYVLQCLPSSLSSICITVWEEMLFEEFQDGCRNGTNLAVLNLHVSLMPRTESA